MISLRLVPSGTGLGSDPPRRRVSGICPHGLANQCRKLAHDDPEAARLLERAIHDAVALCDQEGPIVVDTPAIDRIVGLLRTMTPNEVAILENVAVAVRQNAGQRRQERRPQE